MIIKSLKINKKLLFTLTTIFLIIILLSSFLIISNSIETSSIMFWNNTTIDLEENENYIKWVDFKVTADVMKKTAKLDIDSHNSDSEIKYNWIELLAFLACKNGGNFKKFNQSDLNKLVNELDSRQKYRRYYKRYEIL